MRKTGPHTRDVECPLCHAKPGEECINIGHGTRFSGLSHRERFNALLEREGIEPDGV